MPTFFAGINPGIPFEKYITKGTVMVSEIQQLDFLRDRIHEIRSALFANTSNEAFKLPTCIISALNIDNEGNVCFFIHRPDLYMEEYDMEFRPGLISTGKENLSS